jgi:hypothetical protein
MFIYNYIAEISLITLYIVNVARVMQYHNMISNETILITLGSFPVRVHRNILLDFLSILLYLIKVIVFQQLFYQVLYPDETGNNLIVSWNFNKSMNFQ